MNANLKIVLALAAVGIGIFGITIISNYTQDEVKPPADGGGPTIGGDTSDAVEPVRYVTTQIFYDPKSDNPTLRDFPGFFEVNDQEHPVIYWIQNPNRVPVEVAALSRSCSSCTNVRMAIFPGEARRPEKEEPISALLGWAGAEAAPLADRARSLRDFPADRWKLLDFEHPEIHHIIPPAANDGSPTWVAVQVNFKVRAKGSKNITATLGFKTPTQKLPLSTAFEVAYFGASRYAVTPTALDFGEMGEGTPGKSEDIYYWSTVVGAKDLAPPECSGAAVDPFLTYSKPEALGESERNILAAKLSGSGIPVRVRSGYRITVTLNRKNPDPMPGRPGELDIGPLDKSFAVYPSAGGAPDTDSPRIAVKANVTGLVALAGGGSLDLGAFSSREGTAKPFSLVSDRPDLELEVATVKAVDPRTGKEVERDLTEPSTLRAELEAPKNEGGRRYWRLKVRVDAGATAGAFPVDSAVVLRVKGSGQLVRIPAKGQALLR